MSSTNKTTNYELSQFTQTDKPAWLGDYNLDMSKIDSALHTNASNISTNASNIAINTDDISANAGAISALQDDVDDLDGRTDELENELNLSNISSFDGTSVGTGWTDNLYLAQNSKGEFYKIYGTLNYRNDASTSNILTLTQIPGLLINNQACYGLKTSLKTLKTVQDAYVVNSSGILSIRYNDSNPTTVSDLQSSQFAIGTDGFIYLYAGTSQTYTFYQKRSYRLVFPPCIYINKNFGDTPTPSQSA